MNPRTRKSLLGFPASRLSSCEESATFGYLISCKQPGENSKSFIQGPLLSLERFTDRWEQGALIPSDPALMSLAVTPSDILGTLGLGIFSGSFILTSLFPFPSQKRGKGEGEGWDVGKAFQLLQPWCHSDGVTVGRV